MSFFKIRPRQFDSAIQAFGSTHGGLTADHQQTLEYLVRELRSSLQWSHALALYPFIGDTFARQKLNLKDSTLYPLVGVSSPAVDATHGLTGGAGYATLDLPATTTGILRIYIRWRNAATADDTPLIVANTGLQIMQGVDGPGTFGANWATDGAHTAAVYQTWPYDTARGHRSAEFVFSEDEGLLRVRAGGSASYWHNIGDYNGDPAALPTQITLLQNSTHQISFLGIFDNDDAPDSIGRMERQFCTGLGRGEAAVGNTYQVGSDGMTIYGADDRPILQTNP